VRRVALAVAFCAAAGFASAASAQTPLSVPFLPQTEALCGGAAAAMVMRFYGVRDVYADAFAPLVDWSAGGIRTSVLTRALEERGWQTIAGNGDMPRLRAALTLGRPAIALIEDRPGRYHYVVVVSAVEGGPVIHHDPARAPSRSLSESAFDARWAKADRWMLVLRPQPDTLVPAPPAPDVTQNQKGRSDPGLPPACQSAMDDGIARAGRGDKAGARSAFAAAAAACPDAAAPWRELAGLAALDSDWETAARHARRALVSDAADEHALRVLATAEYVRHHDLEALAAWNALGEPKVDLIDIRGLGETRYMVVANAIGVQPRELLTPSALRLAQKRVRDLPSVSTARVTFHPVESGRAQVDATVVERPRAPRGYPAWISLGLGAAVNHEIATSLVNVSGGGDVVDVTWRWWEHRPRIAASYSAPGPGGIWTIDAFRETQTFNSTTRFEETRTSISAGVGNWLTPRLRIAGAAGMDRWRDRGRTLLGGGRIEFWPVIDRLRVEAGVRGWRGSPDRFATADVRGQWRSNAGSSGTVWIAGGGYQTASGSAPASLWPGADTGHARDVLLRAHPLLDDGIIDGGVFGRRIAFASGEVQRWTGSKRFTLVRIAPAVFVDLARATHGLPDADMRLQIDAGAGIRIALPGFGVLRADVAHGLRDGRTALSVGWQR
jgi:hypothetical protein